MGFDKDDPRPIIQPAKKTTKVNLWMVAGVLLFFILCGVGMAWMRRHHGY